MQLMVFVAKSTEEVSLIVFLGLGQAVGMPIEVGEPADPFATPLEILPEWFRIRQSRFRERRQGYRLHKADVASMRFNTDASPSMHHKAVCFG